MFSTVNARSLFTLVEILKNIPSNIFNSERPFTVHFSRDTNKYTF